MNTELFNIYVEKLVTTITELTKTTILQSAQVTFLERQNANLNKQVEELKASLDKALDKANAKLKKTEATSDF